MPFEKNENLAGALRASLRVIKAEDNARELSPKAGFSGDESETESAQANLEPSPLLEVASDSIDLELDRINQHLIAGVPDKITDESLARAVDLYRAQALRWEAEEATKKPRKSSGPKRSHIEAMEL